VPEALTNTQQRPTIEQWIKQNSDLPRLDCELSICHILGINRAAVLTRPDRLLASSEYDQLELWADALRNNVPFAYLTGEQEFWGLSLSINQDVLVPRPETELLVETALSLLEKNPRVLDLGTGSGAVALAIASEALDAEITATDVSAPALAVAKKNAQRLGLRVKFKQSNWFEDLCGIWKVIVSNPPYIAPQDPHLSALRVEPAHALIAQEQGFADLRKIIGQAPKYLSNQGWLLVEHGYDQALDVRQLFAQAGFQSVSSLRDLADIERLSMGQYVHE
jgi:release factor glutamine methyltransferase